MNKTISVVRIAILFVLFATAMLLLFGEEEGVLRLIVDKAFAFGLFYYLGKLYKRWSKTDPWLKAYDKMCDEVMDAPNPMKL